MTVFRKSMLETSRQYYKAAISKHRLNLEVMMQNGVGVAEHPDIMETIDAELGKMSEYHDKLEMLETYFPLGED